MQGMYSAEHQAVNLVTWSCCLLVVCCNASSQQTSWLTLFDAAVSGDRYIGYWEVLASICSTK